MTVFKDKTNQEDERVVAFFFPFIFTFSLYFIILLYDIVYFILTPQEKSCSI